MSDLRSKKTHEKYLKERARGVLRNGCPLCKDKPIKEFKYWKIVKNKYPYDGIAKTHHMLIPKRHVTYHELNKAEKKEFDSIKLKHADEKYSHFIEPTTRRKSIPSHFHLHLLILRND